MELLITDSYMSYMIDHVHNIYHGIQVLVRLFGVSGCLLAGFGGDLLKKPKKSIKIVPRRSFRAKH